MTGPNVSVIQRFYCSMDLYGLMDLYLLPSPPSSSSSFLSLHVVFTDGHLSLLCVPCGVSGHGLFRISRHSLPFLMDYGADEVELPQVEYGQFRFDVSNIIFTAGLGIDHKGFFFFEQGKDAKRIFSTTW